jgi:hypothetical protein
MVPTLSREQLFVKTEVMENDVFIALQMLWVCAEHIPCRLGLRVAFHIALLIGAICGFRPGVFMQVKYS